VILLDANLPIQAIDADSPHHKRVRQWLEEALSGDTLIGLPWIVVLAFVRITTRAGILRTPLSIEHVIAFIDEWLAQPYVSLIGPGEEASAAGLVNSSIVHFNLPGFGKCRVLSV
jgi:predicted nucleic acid-binding protein